MRTGVKKLLSLFLSVVLCFSVLVGTIPASAFRIDSTLGSYLFGTNWMSGIKDDVLISDISIPGTHDSGAKNVESITATWAQCQSLTISDQLSIGVRYLDMRLEYDTSVTGNVRVVHGSIDCYNSSGGALDLDSVLNDCYKFLDSYPSETIILSVKEDDGSNTSLLANAIMDKIYAKSSYWYTGSSTPKLKDVRKKIVLAKRISQIYGGLNLSWGDQGSDGGRVEVNSKLVVQDRYNMGTGNKWANAAQPMLTIPKPDGTFFLNFLSTTGGGISGVSACASDMNGYFIRCEMKNNKCYGIVIFDFVNENLAKKVYQCNDLISRNQADPSSGQYYYRINVFTSSAVTSGWNQVYLKMYYRTNNGTGSEYCYTVFQNDSGETNGYQYVASARSACFSGIVNGFPTRLEFLYNYTGDNVHEVIDFDMYISDSASGTQNQIISEKYNHWSNGTFSGVKIYQPTSDMMPYPFEICFNGDAKVYYTAPKTGSDTYTNAFSAKIYDQYGVSWNDSPTSYALKTSITGVSMNGNSITISSKLNNSRTQKGTYVCAYYEKNGYSIENTDEKYVVIYPNKIDYQFLGYDGTVLYSSDDYAGVVPEYVGDTPTMPSDETYHYVFTEWQPKTGLSISNYQYTAQFVPEEHTYYEIGVGPEDDLPARLRHHCNHCDYYYDTEYNVDADVLRAALERTKNIEERDYSDESFKIFQEMYARYSALAENYPTQAQVDDAVKSILTAITELVPYLTLNVSAENGSFNVSYNDGTYARPIYTLLFGTEVTLTAAAKEGYRFDGWYENVTKRILSYDEAYTFVITSNTSLTAKYVKSTSSVLTFANESGQICSVVEKSVDEWENVTTLADILPEVPYKAGGENGRWVYDEADVLAKLCSGQSVTIIPEYDDNGFTFPDVPQPVDGNPALNLYYRHDADNNIGTFTMALGVPEGCCVESVGIGFYFVDADEFDPTDFELTINNKLMTGKFNYDDSDGIYIANMNQFTSKYNWAVRGYVTYYDDNGVLKVAYTNQINVIDLKQVS